MRTSGRQDLGRCLSRAAHLHSLARHLEQKGPPNAWLAAGCVVQSVWNLRDDQPAEHGILDYDVVYFDENLSAKAEAAWHQRLQAAFPGKRLDVKNQARVHQWYPRKFGLKIPAFTSVAAAMACWPTTATATAIRWHNGGWRLLAPYGLDDLFNWRLRPICSLASEAVYAAKAKRWKALWPRLEILPWAEALGPWAVNQEPEPEAFAELEVPPGD